jgi:hypothetical protein
MDAPDDDAHGILVSVPESEENANAHSRKSPKPLTVVILTAVLTFGTILIPLGIANARYYKRGNQSELQTQKPREQFTCLTDENCWCD